MATTDDLLKLDLQTRLRIIDELWESVIRDLNDSAALDVPDELRNLLERRRAAYHANPETVSSWPAVRERILKRR